MEFQFNTPRRIEPSEKEIEDSILEYLSFFKGGFAFKMNQGGKPVFKDGKLILIPFQSKYKADGISDIFFLWKSKFHALEVKTEKEYGFVMKNYTRLKEGRFNPRNEKYNHIRNQILFVEKVIASGNRAGFVMSIETAKKIIGV